MDEARRSRNDRRAGDGRELRDAARDQVEAVVAARRIRPVRTGKAAFGAARSRVHANVPSAIVRPAEAARALSRARSRRWRRGSVREQARVAVGRRGRRTTRPTASACRLPGEGGRAPGASHSPPALERAAGPWRSAVLRDDVDDRADRAAAVERALRSADHFDALDLACAEVREVHEAAERVLRDAVDEHERVVGLAAAREDRRQRAAAARGEHRQPGHEPQRIGDRLDLVRARSPRA